MEEINHLPPGFRFYPTDEELISHYLAKKAANRSFTPKAVADVDLNKFEPWDLPDKASMESQKEWYFFNVKDRKYPTGLRTNRATQAGYWKTTGKDKEIIRDGVLIGMKKTLVFYQGRAPKGIKSNWVMHEYRLESYNHSHKSMKDEWVVCRVFKKTVSAKRPHHPASSLSPDSPPSETNSIENITDCIDHRTEMARTTRLNSIADSSSRISISSVQSCNASDNNTGHHDSIISELSHYSRLGAMSSDVSMDYSNLLLKTLQLRSLQQRDHQTMNDIAGLCSSLILHHQQPAGSDIPTNNINLHQTILGLVGLQQPNWNPFS